MKSSGIDYSLLRYSSEIVEYVGEGIFIIHLMLISKGLYFYRHKIPLKIRIEIVCFALFYILYNISVYVVYGILKYILEIFSTPVEKARYFVEKPTTIWLIIMRAFVIIWFIYSWYKTVKSYHTKILYNAIQLLGLIYLLLLPILYAILYIVNTLYRSLYIEFFISIPTLLIHIVNILMIMPCFPWYNVFKQDVIISFFTFFKYILM